MVHSVIESHSPRAEFLALCVEAARCGKTEMCLAISVPRQGLQKLAWPWQPHRLPQGATQVSSVRFMA